MEYKRSQLIGLPIFTFREGPFARIADCIVDPHKQVVQGLLTDEGWSPRAQVIPFSAVQAWSNQGLRVADPKAMVWAKQRPEIEVVLTQANIIGQAVFYPERDEPIGQIIDVLFDQTSRVVGYTMRCTRSINKFWFVPANETRLRQGRVLWFNHMRTNTPQAAANPRLTNGLSWLHQLGRVWHSLWGMFGRPGG